MVKLPQKVGLSFPAEEGSEKEAFQSLRLPLSHFMIPFVWSESVPREKPCVMDQRPWCPEKKDLVTSRPIRGEPRVAVVWGIILLLVSTGILACRGSDREVVYPVRGRVVDRQNQPAKGARVVFHPVGQTGKSLRPLGYVDEQGEYQLTTYERNDGAPAGEYIITVEWRQPPPHPFAADKEGRDLLGGKYSSPDTSELRFRVEPKAENVVPEIRLE